MPQNGQVPASVIQSRLDDIAGGQPMGERLDGANEAGVQQKACGWQRRRFQQATMAVEQSVDLLAVGSGWVRSAIRTGYGGGRSVRRYKKEV